MRALRRLLKLALALAGACVALLLVVTALMAVGMIKPATPKPPFPSVVVSAPPVAQKPTSIVRSDPAPTPTAAPAAVPDRHWYEGGNLSSAGALEWQKASQENKMASCADILAKLWMDKRFTPEFAARVHALDDLKEPATQLSLALDKAFIGDPDPRKNARLLTNQKVAAMAALLVVTMGWVNIE